MSAYPTDAHVALQNAHELVVVVPLFNSNSFGWIWIVSLFRYVSLVDKPAKDLTGATSQTGYGEMADAMNTFLESNRGRSAVQSPEARR